MQKSIQIEIPRPPNFIRTDYKTIPIENFTDEELRDIGKEWTDNLIKNAHQRKKSPKTKMAVENIN